MLFFYKSNVITLQKSVFSSHLPFILKSSCTNTAFIMKKLIQGALLPFAIFSTGILLIGCEQDQPPTANIEQNHTEQSKDVSAHGEVPGNLTNGNMMYIVRDVADMQMKAGNYIEQLKQTQIDLENAVNAQDHQQLKATTAQLHSQLKELNQVLESLNLKSHEVDNIRANILSANEKVLNSSLLKGDLDLSKIDLDKIEQQMGNVQDEMIKLAGMMISSDTKNSH